MEPGVGALQVVKQGPHMIIRTLLLAVMVGRVGRG